MANFINYPQYLLSRIADLIFPKKCIICGRFNDKNFDGYLCAKCLNTIPINHSFGCIGCKRPVALGKTCRLCAKTNHIDQLLVAADYKNQDLIKIIKLFKYRFIKELGLPLSLLTKKYLVYLARAKKLNFLEENPLALPVPLSNKRLNWRGFNQSDILADLLAENFHLEKVTGVISRTGNSKPQAEIEEKDKRLDNLSGLFRISCADKITNKNILLIDDVCTTGATLNECAKILKEAGVKRVTGLVIARG
ncbi:MAG: ComF family protein [Candidatus Yanofskybacteria bacterium]|nr:ComF family protein [Candidatus Yanofskybacteria bacterium]